MMRSITPIPMKGIKEAVGRLHEKSIGTGHDARNAYSDARNRIRRCGI
jgi:hypothetical protein